MAAAAAAGALKTGDALKQYLKEQLQTLRARDRDDASVPAVATPESSDFTQLRALFHALTPLLLELDTLHREQNHTVVGGWAERRHRIDAKRAATRAVADSIKAFNSAVDAASAPALGEAKARDQSAAEAQVAASFASLARLVLTSLKDKNACSPGSRTQAKLYAIGLVIQAQVKNIPEFTAIVAQAAPRPSRCPWRRHAAVEVDARTPLIGGR